MLGRCCGSSASCGNVEEVEGVELDSSCPVRVGDRKAVEDFGTSSSNLSAVINKDLSLLEAMHKWLRLKPGSLICKEYLSSSLTTVTAWITLLSDPTESPSLSAA